MPENKEKTERKFTREITITGDQHGNSNAVGRAKVDAVILYLSNEALNRTEVKARIQELRLTPGQKSLLLRHKDFRQFCDSWLFDALFGVSVPESGIFVLPDITQM